MIYEQKFTVTVYSDQPVDDIDVVVPGKSFIVKESDLKPWQTRKQLNRLQAIDRLRRLPDYSDIFELGDCVRACTRGYGDFPCPGPEKLFDIIPWLEQADSKQIRKLRENSHGKMATKVAEFFAKNDPDIQKILDDGYWRTTVFQEDLENWIKINRPKIKAKK